MNSSITSIHKLNKFVTAKWGEVVVGDLCLVKEDETFPADLIVINSASQRYIVSQDEPVLCHLVFKYFIQITHCPIAIGCSKNYSVIIFVSFLN